MKKFFKTTAVILGVVILSAIILMVISSNIVKCEKGDTKLEKKNCYYISTICKQNETATAINETSVCVYEGNTLMNNTIFQWIMIISVIILFIIGIFYISISTKKGKPPELGQFRKEDFIPVKRAKEVIALTLSRMFGIPIVDNKPSMNYFDFKDSVPYPFGKEGEMFWKAQVEVTSDNKHGIYTFVVSLSRGEVWIETEMFRIRPKLFDEYKISRDRPLYIIKDPQERAIERLSESGRPEQAFELAQQLAMRRVQQPMPEQPPEEGQQPLQQPLPRVKRPARRYGQRRGYYG